MKTPQLSIRRQSPSTKPNPKTPRPIAWLLACGAASGLVASEPRAAEPAGLPSRAPRVLALSGGVALVGTERGLYRWSEAEARWIALLGGSAIDDLAAVEGEVLIAAEGELYRWTPGSDAPQRVALPPGVGARSVAADARGRAFVATEEGLFIRGAAGGEFARASGAPLDPVSVRAVGAEVWVAAGRALWAERPDGSFERRLAGLGEGSWELRAGVVRGGTTWLAVPEGLWRIDASGPRLQPLSAPVIGAVGLASGLAAVTEDALHCLADGEADAGSLASAVVLSKAVSATSAIGGGVAVLEASGVRTLACSTPPPATALSTVPVTLPPPTEVIELQRAMLAHLDLEPGRLRAAEGRTRRRARLPEVALGFSGDMARAREHGRDQNVTTGRVNDLVDASRARDGGAEARLQLTWELWRDAEPDALIAISRERRELIELREQILDRFNRTYFELWRVRGRLAAAPRASSDRAELEVRARELAAVLDAWTGGVFSRVDRAPRPPAKSGTARP